MLASQPGALAPVAQLALDDLRAVAEPRSTTRVDGDRTVAQLFLHADIDGALTPRRPGDTGGIATLLVHLGDALLRAEPPVCRVLTLSRGRSAAALTALADVAKPGHHYLSVPLWGPSPQAARAWPLWVAARRGIRRVLRVAGQVDALHLRMADVGSLAAASAAHELGVPLVLTLAPDPHALVAAREQAGELTRANVGDGGRARAPRLPRQPAAAARPPRRPRRRLPSPRPRARPARAARHRRRRRGAAPLGRARGHQPPGRRRCRSSTRRGDATARRRRPARARRARCAARRPAGRAPRRCRWRSRVGRLHPRQGHGDPRRGVGVATRPVLSVQPAGRRRRPRRAEPRRARAARPASRDGHPDRLGRGRRVCCSPGTGPTRPSRRGSPRPGTAAARRRRRRGVYVCASLKEEFGIAHPRGDGGRARRRRARQRRTRRPTSTSGDDRACSPTPRRPKPWPPPSARPSTWPPSPGADSTAERTMATVRDRFGIDTMAAVARRASTSGWRPDGGRRRGQAS